MAYLRNTDLSNNADHSVHKDKFYKKSWFKIAAPIILVLLIVGSFSFWKADTFLNKISNGGLLSSLAHSLPGVVEQVDGEGDGRVNVLLLGMRGADLPGGGTLADTIMIASIMPKENKISMISLPRDLYVNNPGWGHQTKINAVYAAGQENGKEQGLSDMKKVVSEITGLPIHYGASIDFAGFRQMIDAIGGIDITLASPFDEAVQFNEPHVCDAFFTVRTGQWQNKIKSTHTVNGKKVSVKVPMYPLCTAPLDKLECGGNFKLPAGAQTLDGEQALCYARSRATSNDFERAKRQQLIVQLVKEKLLSAGTLTDFDKLNGILASLSNNVRTDLQLWEIKRLYELYIDMENPQTYQRVLENSAEGLLYNPTNMPKEVGYILLPIGDNYDKIHEMARNIFTLPKQSDIQPK